MPATKQAKPPSPPAARDIIDSRIDEILDLYTNFQLVRVRRYAEGDGESWDGRDRPSRIVADYTCSDKRYDGEVELKAPADGNWMIFLNNLEEDAKLHGDRSTTCPRVGWNIRALA